MVTSAEELVAAEIPDPELTCLSLGACYMAAERYTPLYVNRLPAKVTLEDTSSGASVEYEPYQHFVPNFNPAKPFVSKSLPLQANPDVEFVLTVADTDGKQLLRQPVDFSRSGILPGASRSPLLLINTLGIVGVSNGGLPWNGGRPWVEIEHPPWQTDLQREVHQSILTRQREFSEANQQRLHRNVTYDLFGYQHSSR